MGHKLKYQEKIFPEESSVSSSVLFFLFLKVLSLYKLISCSTFLTTCVVVTFILSVDTNQSKISQQALQRI